jgi:hypothetical protein
MQQSRALDQLARIPRLKDHLRRILDVLQYESKDSPSYLYRGLIILDLIASIQQNQSPELAFIIEQQKSAIFILQQGMYTTDRDITDPQIALVAPAESNGLMVSRDNQT